MAETEPAKPAHIVGSTGECVTYAELNSQSLRFAHLLHELGLTEGDTVAFQMANTARIFEVIWGALRSGLFLAQIETGFSADRVEHILRDSGAKLFVTDFQHAAVASEVRQKGYLGVAIWLMADGVVAGYESFEEALRAQRDEPLRREPEGKVMNYSGGSTGMPKAVKGSLPGRQLGDPAPEVLNRGRLWGYSAATVQTCAAPTTRLLMAYSVMAQRFGGTVIVNDSPHPIDVLRYIETYQVTHLQTLPQWFLKIYKTSPSELGTFDLSSLEYICHAGAPCPPKLKSAMMEQFGTIIHEYYSGSEGAGMTYISPDDWLRHPGSVGRAIVGTVHILGADGEEVPTGEPGDIYFEGGPKFEYHNAPELTEKAYNQRGWATLGDVGRLDKDGYLYLLDRADNVIMLSNKRVYCQPIEDELLMLRDVEDAAVLSGKADDLVVLVESVKVNGSDSRNQQITELVANGAGIETSSVHVHVVPSLGRPLTGKLNKKQIRTWYQHILEEAPEPFSRMAKS